MSNPAKGSKRSDQKLVSILAKKNARFITGIVICLFIAILYLLLRDSSLPSTEGSVVDSANTNQNQDKPKLDHLVGRWLRPDGGYILEIHNIGKDGKLDIGYFNPNPINIGRAEWAEKDDKYYIMVELQDINYPGSTYGLEYITSQDKLVGTYYQAAEKTTYDVEFVREK